MNNLEKLFADEPGLVLDALCCDVEFCEMCKAYGFCNRSDPRASREWLTAEYDGSQPCQTDGKGAAAQAGRQLPEEPDDDVSKPLHTLGS